MPLSRRLRHPPTRSSAATCTIMNENHCFETSICIFLRQPQASQEEIT